MESVHFFERLAFAHTPIGSVPIHVPATAFFMFFNSEANRRDVHVGNIIPEVAIKLARRT